MTNRKIYLTTMKYMMLLVSLMTSVHPCRRLGRLLYDPREEPLLSGGIRVDVTNVAGEVLLSQELTPGRDTYRQIFNQIQAGGYPFRLMRGNILRTNYLVEQGNLTVLFSAETRVIQVTTPGQIHLFRNASIRLSANYNEVFQAVQEIAGRHRFRLFRDNVLIKPNDLVQDPVNLILEAATSGNSLSPRMF